MRIVDPQQEMRDLVTSQASKGGSKVLNLYAISDKPHTTLMLVIARSSEEALKLIQHPQLKGWTLAETTTRRIQRNVDAEIGIVATVPLHGQKHKFRMKLGGSSEVAKLVRQREAQS